MRLARFYTEQILSENQSVILEDAPSHHMLKVLRMQPSEPLLLFNGDGKEYQAVLEIAEGKKARVRIGSVDEPRRESALRISLGQGISRGERMDLVVQKAVELGASEITPLWTRRSQVQLSGARLEKRLAHWRSIVLAACEQSGRVHLPAFSAAATLTDWLASGQENSCGVILDPDAQATLRDVEPPGCVRVLIGPEGGFERNEVDAAVAAGFRRVRLGPRTLRTETATLAALAALQTLWGDLTQ